MPKYLLPYFGALENENLEAYYDVYIVLNGQNVQIDLNFEKTSVDTKLLDNVKQFLGDILSFDEKNRRYIEEDYASQDGEAVKAYLEHNLEELDKDQLSMLVDFNDDIVSQEVQLLHALKLVRVGLYPDNEGQFAVFDYSIGKNMTQYLIVVNTDYNGNLDSIAMES